MTIRELDAQLERLREKWRSGTGDREILIRQARSLQIAKEKILKKQSYAK